MVIWDASFAILLIFLLLKNSEAQHGMATASLAFISGVTVAV